MGVSTRIQLPNEARLRDVSKVIGIAAGLPAKYETFSSGNGGMAVVDGIKVTSSSMPECAQITWGEGENAHYVLYHFEWEDGGHGLLPYASPFWCAVGLKLVKLFGGSIQFADYTDGYDMTFPLNPLCKATNNDEWEAWQQAMLAVGPITKDDLRESTHVATYK